ncbi:MAG: DUF4405 domain-containing protein [Campylobacterales bacterium]|nr:DUF4405 domain-containing protein [Campylobacterales bacterium]
MRLERGWVTPLAGGLFLIMAVTGILMFFHIDTGLNKVAHEWLGLFMVVVVVLHIVLNFKGFVNSLKTLTGKTISGIFVVLLMLSFLSLNGEGPNKPFVLPIGIMAKADIADLSKISRIGEEELVRRLQLFSSTPINAQSSVNDIAKDDLHKQMELLNKILQ